MVQRLERIYPFILISCKIVASFLGHQEFPLSFNEREEAKSLFAQINHLHKIKGFPTENLWWSLIEGRSPDVCKSEMLYQSFNRQWCKESLMMIERASKLHVHQVKFNLSLEVFQSWAQLYDYPLDNSVTFNKVEIFLFECSSSHWNDIHSLNN